MKFPNPLVLASAAWIAATGFTAVFGFGASAATAWLICGALSGLFGLTFFYLAWEFRRAESMPGRFARAARADHPRMAQAPRGMPIYDRIQPTARLSISARSAASQIRRTRQRATVGNP